MATTLAPFLMFEGAAGEAIDLYARAFPDAEVLDVRRYGDDGPGRAGTVEHARLRIGEAEVRLIDSPVEHAFDFTPMMSLFVDLDSPTQVEDASDVLGKDGEVLMPIGEYPFSPRFVWLNDRFGVSWQLSARPA
jgi:predicted 3-demethylubiquinone-9 3-methyltransferase (glyoxalase superfamily)